MLKDNRTIKKYSESFKLKVLSEIESGKYTKTEVCNVYGIGTPSLYRWIKKFDKLLNCYIVYPVKLLKCL